MRRSQTTETFALLTISILALLLAAAIVATIRNLCPPSRAVLFETLPALTPPAGPRFAEFDELLVNDRSIGNSPLLPLRLGPAASLEVRGSAYDPVARTRASAVVLAFDDGSTVRAVYDRLQTRRRKLYYRSGVAADGFYGVVSTQGLLPGPHVLHVRVVAANLAGYYEPLPPLRIDVR